MKLTYSKAHDFSQHGTQEVIFKFFGDHPPAYNLLVDVGAFGRFMSNAYGLLKEGWKGLLIDANPERIEAIKKEFSGLDVKVLNIGIGDVSGSSRLHLSKIVGIDSFKSDWFPESSSGRSVLVQVEPLSAVLMERGFPSDFDLLNVDAEGWDEKIINSLFQDGLYRPRLIVVESYAFPSASYLFRGNGYSLYALCGPPMNGNLIFYRKE